MLLCKVLNVTNQSIICRLSSRPPPCHTILATPTQQQDAGSTLENCWRRALLVNILLHEVIVGCTEYKCCLCELCAGRDLCSSPPALRAVQGQSRGLMFCFIFMLRQDTPDKTLSSALLLFMCRQVHSQTLNENK